MKRLNGLVAASLLLMSFSSSASRNSFYPEKYKEIFEGQTLQNEELKAAIYDVLGKYHKRNGGAADTLTSNCDSASGVNCFRQRSMSYKTARKHLFGQLHLERDENGYFINEVYCNKRITRRITDIGPMKVPNTKYINCEHTWPQSRFSSKFPKNLQKGDLHHLFPTDSRANSTRGNYQFGEVEAAYAYQGCTDSKFAKVKTPQGNMALFQPPVEHRGNVARALFYFSVRYNKPISEREEAVLKKWHHEDPVDENEMIRNSSIEDIQYNRNPFIDYPELADAINNF